MKKVTISTLILAAVALLTSCYKNYYDISQSTLDAIKERTAAMPYSTAIPLTTGAQHIVIDNQWTVESCVWIQQDNPLPCTIVGIIPDVRGGDTDG